MAKVLIVEDEMSIRTFIKIKLKAIRHEVIDVENGKDALKIIDDTFDIALLDVMLKDMDGMLICRKIHDQYPHMGIIMLTAKGQEKDKILGFDSGADDYMVKPFSPKELVVRMNALLRRIKDKPIIKRIIDGPFELNMDQRTLRKNGQMILLTPTEYDILQMLMTHKEKAISRDELLNGIWGEDYVGDMKTVDVHVRRIRKKIEDNPSNPKYVQAVWGHGYMWSVSK